MLYMNSMEMYSKFRCLGKYLVFHENYSNAGSLIENIQNVLWRCIIRNMWKLADRIVRVYDTVIQARAVTLKQQSHENQCGLQMFNFLRRQQCYHLSGCETCANRTITAQSWDYLVYLRNLAVHKVHLPHHRMTSQSVQQLCNYEVI